MVPWAAIDCGSKFISTSTRRSICVETKICQKLQADENIGECNLYFEKEYYERNLQVNLRFPVILASLFP